MSVSTQARTAALLFSAAHTVMSLVGLVRPGLYGFLLGDAGYGVRVRTLAGAALATILSTRADHCTERAAALTPAEGPGHGLTRRCPL